MDIGELLYNIFFITLYLIVLVLILWALMVWIVGYFRGRNEKRYQYNLTFMQIRLPKDNEIEIKAAEQMFSGLAGIRKTWFRSLISGRQRISFEIVSKKDSIGFYVVAPDELAQLVEKQINGSYPDAEIDIVDPEEVWDRGAYTSVMELKLAGPPYYPIKVYEDMGGDTMSGLTSAMSKLGEDEAIAVQYVIGPASDSWRSMGQRFTGGVKAAQSNPEKPKTVDGSFVDGVEKKIGKTGFDVAVRVVSLAQDKVNSEAHLQNVLSAFEQFTDVKYNRFKRRPMKSQKSIIDDFIFRRLKLKNIFIPLFDIAIFRSVSLLNTEELATIFHFPNKEVQTPRIAWLEAKKFAAPSNLPTDGIYLGKNIYRGSTADVLIKREDRRRHMYMIGQTGTGKSTLLMYLAAQDIQNGEGVCVIDPHGSDITELLEKVPPERLDDVILFDVGDIERPLGLNILQAETEEQKNIVINAFIALLYKLYDPNKTGMIGPQLERAVRNVMLTAMADPEATMVDVLRMLIDDNYHKRFLPMVDDPLVVRYWTDEIANTSASRKGETMGYFVSKFDRFVTEKTMRNIIGQPKSALNFTKIMEEKKILLVDLSKGKIGEENSNFLGLLLVPRILSAAMSRHKMLESGQDFPDFYLYVDEFQNFATPDFATILSEARKYKLNLTVANQFIAQLTDEIKTAIFGNVGSTTAFRVGNDDAEYLEKQFEPATKNDLMNTATGNAYMRLLIDGQPSRPFSLKLPWEEVSAQKRYEGNVALIKERSRNKYGVPAAEIEEYINKKIGINAEDPVEKDPKDVIRDLF